jgi:hypothetical protein
LPNHSAQLHRSAHMLLDGYAPHINWEPAADLMGRVAALLPLLALARVDGASPVEYLTPQQRSQVRQLARALLSRPVSTVDLIVDDWMLTTRGATAGATHSDTTPIKEQTP